MLTKVSPWAILYFSLREKEHNVFHSWVENKREGLQGLKPAQSSLTLAARLKPCPCYKASAAGVDARTTAGLETGATSSAIS
jgi:hypothetical protein